MLLQEVLLTFSAEGHVLAAVFCFVYARDPGLLV